VAWRVHVSVSDLVAGVVTGASLLVTAAGCAEGPKEEQVGAVTPPGPDESHARLSDWGLFATLDTLSAAPGVLEYGVISPIHADYADIRRFMYVPDGSQIGYEPTESWQLPNGSVLAQAFAYEGARKLETRLLLREQDSWRPFVYIWRDDQHDAVLEQAGETVDVAWTDASGEGHETQYHAANIAQCVVCHGSGREDSARTALRPLAVRTRQLNRTFAYDSGSENQIDYLATRGVLDDEPLPALERQTLVSPFGDSTLDDRVRSYFDGNCAHCHSKGSYAAERFLWLDYPTTDPTSGDAANWGVCKVPTAAGAGKCNLTYDVLPGKPDESIMVCRMSSLESQKRMPTMGSQVVHAEAVELIRDWIAAMPPAHCSESE
jgi:uncharacterized repeat protein (TIGR03806 family)